MAFLFFANAIFASANKGVEDSFVSSLTGDVVMGAATESSFSLFGNEIPVVDDYEVIPSIMGYSEIEPMLGSLQYAESYSPVVSAAAAVEIGDFRSAAAVFGIVPESYFNVCSAIEIVKGDPSDISNGGIFLCQPLLRKIERKLNRKIAIGEDLKLSLYSNGSFKIRKGVFAGCHRYVNRVAPFDAIVLADPSIVRGLIDYTAGNIIDSGDTGDSGAVSDDFDMDDLFDDASDVVEEDSNALSLDFIEALLADTAERDAMSAEASNAWSYVLFRAADGERGQLMKELRNLDAENKLSVNVRSWRQGAGLSAQMVFALQAAFNVGIVFIIIGAVLVIMNALMISVLERSYEIGTMRGIGAGKPFISALFIAESMLLTMVAAVVGIILGIIISMAFSGGIELHNTLLITMFGGDMLVPAVTLKNILLHLGGAAIIGALSWIYPVSVAVKIQPVAIMGRL
ncbi:MAG: FtsX-like permease family protein [Spirochaetia bacterium]|nr:FtsX-like permease family protein [Spirochaetia bacterium]